MKNDNGLADYTVEDLFCSKARVKILRELALEGELNISKIIEKTNLNHSCVMKHLNFLQNIGFLDRREYGRIKIYRYKEENVKANSVKVLIESFENGLSLSVRDLFYSKNIIRIIKTLVLYNSLNVTRIVKFTKSNYSVIKKHLDFLTEKGFLIAKNFGRIRIYDYNNENNGAYSLKKLIEFIEEENEKDYISNFSELQD